MHVSGLHIHGGIRITNQGRGVIRIRITSNVNFVGKTILLTIYFEFSEFTSLFALKLLFNNKFWL